MQYFNDSKATNVDATLKAIEAFDGNLWIILGGKDKGSELPAASRAVGTESQRRAFDWGSAALSVCGRACHSERVAGSGSDCRVWQPGGSGEARPLQCRLWRHCAAGSCLRQLRPVPKLRRAGQTLQTFSGRIVLIAMAQRLKTDWILFLTVLCLVCFGLVMVYSSSSMLAELRYHVSDTYFFFRQLGWAVFSFILLLLCMKRDYRAWNDPRIAFSALGIVMLLLVIVYVTDSNSHRWLRAGPFGLQPSELAKPALALFLAFFVCRRLGCH